MIFDSGTLTVLILALILALAVAIAEVIALATIWQRQRDMRGELDTLNRSWRSVLSLADAPRTPETEPFQVAEPMSPLADPEHLLACPPMVHTADGEYTLAYWIRHFSKIPWPTVITTFYDRLLGDDEVKGYFPTDPRRASTLKSHFATVAIQVMDKGITVGNLQTLREAHQGVRNSRGEPITGAVYDKTIGTLVGVLGEAGVSGDAIGELARMLNDADVRSALVHEEHAVLTR